MTDDANSFITKGLCWASYLSLNRGSYFPSLGCEKPQRANTMAPSPKPLPEKYINTLETLEANFFANAPPH